MFEVVYTQIDQFHNLHLFQLEQKCHVCQLFLTNHLYCFQLISENAAIVTIYIPEPYS